MKKLIINYDNDNFLHIKADYLQDCDIDFSAKIYISGYAAHSILTGKKNGTLISQEQIIPIIPILMYFDQEVMIANITLNISIGYFISNFA
jgi:hypothetical protein